MSLSVRLLLSNPGEKPWIAAGAALADSTGEEVELAAWQDAPIPAGGDGVVVVGTQREPGPLVCPCALKLWESPGTRVVALGNVTFPDTPKAVH
jgi:hypothetical protein